MNTTNTKSTTNTMKKLPIAFNFFDLVAGNGFVAYVSVEGRAVLSEEEGGEVMCHGVGFGDIAGGGRSDIEATQAFKQIYLSHLWNIASEATSFSEFEYAVTKEFENINTMNKTDWDVALVLSKANESYCDTALPAVRYGTDKLSVQRITSDNADSGMNTFDLFMVAV